MARASQGCLTHLLQDLGESKLVRLHKLLQFVQITAEETEAFVQRDISGGQFGGMFGSGL